MTTSTTSRLLATAICVLAVGCPPSPQQGDIWIRTFHGAGLATDLAQTPDGGFLYTTGPRTANGPYVLKLDATGDEVWHVSGGGANGLAITPNGDCVVSGPVGQPPGTVDNLDTEVRRFDANGNEVWSKLFADESLDECYDVQATLDGGFILVGLTVPLASDGSGIQDWDRADIRLTKIDASGQSQWSRTIDVTGSNGQDNSVDYGYAVVETPDGGFVIVGQTGSRVLGDGFVLKTDSTGVPEWVNHPLAAEGYLKDVCLTSDGGYAVVGSSTFATEYYGLYLAKINDIGDLVWDEVYGGQANDISKGTSIEPIPDGGYILVGERRPGVGQRASMYLVKTNGTGSKLWSRTYRFEGNTDTLGKAVCLTDDQGYVALGTGSYWDNTTQSFATFCHLVKTDSMGNVN